LFVALTRIGQGASSPATLGLLECAETLSQSNDPLLRAASAWGLVRMGNVESHEAAMIALVRDTDWVTRANACRALAVWAPTPELAIAVADRLGDCDGYDGYPNADALETLVAWKQQSAPAVPRIGRWLDEADVDAGDLSADSLLELLQSLGPQSVALVPQVTRFVAANGHEENEQNADAEADEYAEDEPADEPFDLSSIIEGLDLPAEIVARLPVEAMQMEIDEWAEALADPPDGATGGGSDDLVQRLGLDPNEDIPGTRSSKELAEEPDTEARLRHWIARMS